ncbi:MAG: hypothetical protein MI866_17445 [Bacteroidales bacterium]|nr:hypothetical protein [Bacteroidales bacterium]
MKAISFIGLLFASIFVLEAQTTSDVFTGNDFDYYWYGIDYSKTNLIGDFGSGSMVDDEPAKVIKEKYFNSWNDLIVKERAKFDVAKMLRKDTVVYDIEMIKGVNGQTDWEKLAADNGKSIDNEVIKQMVSGYALEQTEGVGLVFINEYMDKTNAKASYVFVVFNIATREILVKKQYTMKPSGFGIRNHWAGSYHRVFKQITSKDFKNWQKSYN